MGAGTAGRDHLSRSRDISLELVGPRSTSLVGGRASVRAQGDQTLWLLISSTLLALAVPGVALFYGGMVRKKNIMNTIALPFVALAVVSLAWTLVGSGWAAWNGAEQATSHEEALRSLYRGMMASVALALVAGGIVERIRFSFFLVFGLCWVAAVYVPLAQSLWGGNGYWRISAAWTLLEAQ